MRIASRSRGRHSAQAGDTIVEVLIALAVVSLVLVGAFVTSNKSTQATRDSQEHAEATQDIKTQIELARVVISAATDSASDPTATTDKIFCIVQSGATPSIKTFDTSDYPNNGTKLLALDSDTFQSYPDECHQSGGSYNYYIAIENHITNPSLAANTLLAHARWDSISGGRNEVTFAYRAHAAVPKSVSNPNGDAVIGDSDCSVNNTCGHPDPTKWYFDVYRPNLSTNPDSTVAGCKWDWGDGTPPEISGSSNGTPINADCYGRADGSGGHALHIMHNIPASQNPLSVAPPSSWCHDYIITLTEYFNNGAIPAVYQYTLFLPYGPPSYAPNCGPG